MVQDMDHSMLKQALREGKIRWSTHCLERMNERDISILDVKECILQGEIIEDYPTDFPHPSCLVYAITANQKVIHVVAGYDGDYIYFITAYYPSSSKFEPDMKTRRN